MRHDYCDEKAWVNDITDHLLLGTHLSAVAILRSPLPRLSPRLTSYCHPSLPSAFSFKHDHIQIAISILRHL